MILMSLMLASSGAAVLLHPERQAVAQVEKLGLETLVPAAFGDWRIDDSVAPVQPPPEVQEKVAKIYDETLARTYINSRGDRVMLSIAYGGDQTGRLRVHRPESCYTAQGFSVKQLAIENLHFGDVTVPAKRLMAQMGGRQEPITYWIRVGGETVTGMLGQRLVQLKSGLLGQVPDGLLFRVSSLGAAPAEQYLLQDAFVGDLVRALGPQKSEKLVGKSLDVASAKPE
nr:exosortase-associated protein EpsI, B-type [Duganella violaceicalia]